eukprot:TRINITY_DN17244_c0_g1_i1.p1 TRINITY_DN17244_c0_g1~~TRINITY_DN17244_c0_g1_i1.p1  ORF type:complete len:138 (-),score=20.53 TRINITY_DN17244_c0_g1_i1:171-539(-)
MSSPEGDNGDFPLDGYVSAGVPLSIFEEGLQARKRSRQILKAKEVDEKTCEETRIICEGSFRKMRDAFVVDCHNTLKNHRCNRLRDLLEECQETCEAAFRKCKAKAPPASIWQKFRNSAQSE